MSGPDSLALGEAHGLLSGARLETLSRVVLRLHQGSHGWRSDSFQAQACELVGELLPYGACLWGQVPAELPLDAPPSGGGLHAEGLTPDVLAACLAGRGPLPDVRALAVEPLTRRRIELHLWRQTPTLHGMGYLSVRSGYDDGQRAALHFLMPHLAEAQRENRLSRARQDNETSARSLLLADLQGRLQHADEAALSLLRAEWPRWSGLHLPEILRQPLVEAAAGSSQGRDFQGRHIAIQLARSGDLMLLDVRRRAAVDRLSNRQRDIALLYAEGLTGPQIATRLGLSSSTVNNHLGVIFKKLGVANKVQLLHAVQRLPH